MNNIYLLLGSNLGDRLGFLASACAAIDKQVGQIISKSGIYQTAAWGVKNQPGFLNQALRIYSPISAFGLLTKTQAIESSLDRTRTEHWGPRTIDIDLLLYNDEVIVEEGLIVPHRLMHKRRFALAPMVEIAPDIVHPLVGRSLKEILDNCSDPLKVERILLQDV